MKKLSLTIIIIMGFTVLKAQTIPTTTVTGNLKVNDSLVVTNNISNQGNISSSGDIKATGEIVSRDTMRAEKDVIIDGNASVGGNLKVIGNTKVGNLRVGGSVSFGGTTLAPSQPCDISLMMAIPDPANPGSVMLGPLSQAAINTAELAFISNPCAPVPPVTVPFTWNTFGNSVTNESRWIGTVDNYDFNIKTNNVYRMVIKKTGDIGIGAYGGNGVNALASKFRLVVSNTGDINAGVQNAGGIYPFTVKTNGATYIGFGRPKGTGVAANAMLSVDGLILAKEIKVAIANTHWADYVFEKNYSLMPLRDVEKFILQNKHLPEVPTEVNVKEDGIDVADMNATLLKKIEELTLYLIEQDKRLEAVEKENAVIKKQLKNN